MTPIFLDSLPMTVEVDHVLIFAITNPHTDLDDSIACTNCKCFFVSFYQLPIGVPTILRSFIAFISGNVWITTNHESIKIIPIGIYWLFINYCLCFVDTKWTHIVHLKETEFTHSWWCNFKWSNNSKEKTVLFVHFNSVQRDNKTSKGMYRLRWNSKCSICTKHTEGKKKDEGESIWDTTAIFHTTSWKCLT